MSYTQVVALTRRRAEPARSTLRTQRKRRDVAWRHRPRTQVGAYFGVRQDLSAQAPEDGQNRLRLGRMPRSEAPRISADSVLSGFDFSLVFSDRKSTRLNSSHLVISYAVFCLKK